MPRLGRAQRYLEGSGRQRPKKVLLTGCPIEPRQSLVAQHDGHLAIVEWRHIWIRLGRENREGFRPVTRRWLPDSGEIEPVAVRERDTIVLPAASMPRLGRWYEATMGWKRAAFRSNEREGAARRFTRSQTP